MILGICVHNVNQLHVLINMPEHLSEYSLCFRSANHDDVIKWIPR